MGMQFGCMTIVKFNIVCTGIPTSLPLNPITATGCHLLFARWSLSLYPLNIISTALILPAAALSHGLAYGHTLT